MAAAGTQVQAAGLVKYTVVEHPSIPESLTKGDPVRGRAAVINRQKGNCLACHSIPEIPEEQFHGEVGPVLDDVGSRMSAGEIRMRIVDPKVINPETAMPSFYKLEGLHRVAKKWQGKTILSAQEVEDVVAYMLTLKGSYSN
ncbi:MAG: sulfur oxidation c-type cytochrome SoxX [Rhodobacterales bacterium]|nr:sulfur oxidation c-type cytochrome SoxX [Rhodobacterales bacterium]